MPEALYVSDLHGKRDRYLKLFDFLLNNPPEVLLIGGDLLEPFMQNTDSAGPGEHDFINKFLAFNLNRIREQLNERYPLTLLIMGNDDPRYFESALITAGQNGLWTYLHHRKLIYNNHIFYGYNYVPPTPFLLKDWERYDVSRYVDIGSISPEEGHRSFPASEHEIKWSTIKEDLDNLTIGEDMNNAIFLFHAPPYQTDLDLGETNGRIIDYAHVDEHMGSIAIKRFIEERQPLITFHGHIHESSMKSRRWMQKIGRTFCINAAHDGKELLLIRLDLESPDTAERYLI